MQWGATAEEIVRAWMAFKELREYELVLVNIGPAGTAALKHGWSNWWGACTNAYFMKRILDSPRDFRLAHDVFGFDILSRGYSCLSPGDLPRILAEHKGVGDPRTLFDPFKVAKEVRRLSIGS